METWRLVKGYRDLYEVSSEGNVRSLTRHTTQVSDSGKTYTRVIKGRLLKPSSDTNGYLKVNLSKQGKTEMCQVHRLVAEAFVPNPDKLPVVRHKDDTPSNCRKDNLLWGTYQDNMDDMTSRGRQAKGSTQGSAVLTEKNVARIKKLLRAGRSGVTLANEFGVSQATISCIKNGTKWTHVT